MDCDLCGGKVFTTCDACKDLVCLACPKTCCDGVAVPKTKASAPKPKIVVAAVAAAASESEDDEDDDLWHCGASECRFPESHTTAGHKCGTCGKFGHGQLECGNPKIISALVAGKLPKKLQCSLLGCRFKTAHVDAGHQCGECEGFGHSAPTCPGVGGAGKKHAASDDVDDAKPKKKAKVAAAADDDSGDDDGDDDLSGLVFCITGTLSVKRAVFVSKLEAAGATVAKTVTKAVTHLVCSDPNTSKAITAKGKGVAIVDEAWVNARLGGSGKKDTSAAKIFGPSFNASGFWASYGDKDTAPISAAVCIWYPPGTS